ncbi:MAG: alpha/beta hydrolase [Acidimicrobiales bacterium]|nr:alpha/beta hydrolase [Acidimicrobiales bacterium]
MSFIDVGDLRVYHEFHGEGPPLLHISGSGGDLRATMPDRSPLNRDFRGLHYDQRGLGRTSRGDRQPTMADFADDAAALCAAVGWERCHVMGTSFGGMVAQHLAIRHPQLVERLVLNCTSPGGDAPSYPLHELQSLDGEARADAWMPIMDTRYEPGGELPGLEGFTTMFRDRQRSPLPAEAAEGFAAQLEARRCHDASAGLASITSPTLVCAGRYDGIAPVSNSERIAAAIPHARLEIFDGGHIFMMQDPRAMTTIRDFLLAD